MPVDRVRCTVQHVGTTPFQTGEAPYSLINRSKILECLQKKPHFIGINMAKIKNFRSVMQKTHQLNVQKNTKFLNLMIKVCLNVVRC